MQRGGVLTEVLNDRMPTCTSAGARRALAGELGITYVQLMNEWTRIVARDAASQFGAALA